VFKSVWIVNEQAPFKQM